MPNLPLQNLQNLLSNQSKKINLITEEYSKITVTEDQNKSFENIFLVTSIILTLLLSFLTYYNFQKNSELTGKYSQFVNNISGIESLEISQSELKSRVSDLEKYKASAISRVKVNEFFVFLTKIFTFLRDERIIEINYNLSNKKIEYNLVVNSSKINLNQDLNTFFQENLTPNKVEKVREINIPQTTLKQYEFKGTYEIR
jgi:hypothetical protein